MPRSHSESLSSSCGDKTLYSQQSAYKQSFEVDAKSFQIECQSLGGILSGNGALPYCALAVTDGLAAIQVLSFQSSKLFHFAHIVWPLLNHAKAHHLKILDHQAYLR